MQGLHHGLVVLEMDGLEHFAYPAVEAFHHPVRLGVISLFEPVVDAMFLAGLIEQVVFGRVSFGGLANRSVKHAPYRSARRDMGNAKKRHNGPETPQPT